MLRIGMNIRQLSKRCVEVGETNMMIKGQSHTLDEIKTGHMKTMLDRLKHQLLSPSYVG